MITLRPHQIAAVDAVEQSFREGTARPLIDACVGAGKSLMYAELARREIARGGRVIIGAHTRELVEQNAAACRSLGLEVGINAAALNERCWRAPVISAAIQSVYKNGVAFGPISMLIGDEAHLWPHSESGMYRALHRALAYPRLVGGSGTVFRLQGGSLIEGTDAPFERVVYTYSILNGIRDGYLVPAYSAPALDKIDPSKLRTRQGEFTGESQDDQMLAAIDNHIAQMVHFGEDRRGWLIFEASTKAARAMAARLGEWGVPTGLVLGTTPAGERTAIVEAYRAGRLRALVNVAALCLDEETEILTSDGFVGIDAMTMQHRIAAWKEDGGVEFTPPKLIVRRDLMPHERMIRLTGRSTPRIRVTSNHRMVVRCGDGLKKTKVIAAEELMSPVWRTIPAYGTCEPELLFAPTPIAVSSRAAQVRANSYSYRKKGIDADEARRMAETHANRIRSMRYKHPYELTHQECELIGFWLGDGTKSCGRVSLTQSLRYPDTIARIDYLLLNLGIAHSRQEYRADRPTAFPSVRWTLARGTGGAGQEVTRGYFELEPYLKKDGTWLYWGLNRPQLEHLLHGLWMADGLHHAKHQILRVTGIQKTLYELLQAICSVRGISATVQPVQRRECHIHQQYVFAWGGRDQWRVHGKNSVKELRTTKSERVWCVTSSTSYLICRRNGKVFVTGNTTGFDVQHVDMLVMRRRTKSLGLYVQQVGRGLRTIGGNIEASIASGKADCLVLDFAGNIDQHGPLDFIRPKSTKPSLTACDACGTRNVSASRTCWSCGATLLKNCPACLMAIEKDEMTCPHCDYDMRTGPVEVKKSLSDRPSDSAIIAAYKSDSERVGGWLPIGQLWEHEGRVWAGAGEAVSELGVDERFRAARWLRIDPLAILVPHGSSRTIARQINIADGSELIVPMPQNKC